MASTVQATTRQGRDSEAKTSGQRSEHTVRAGGSPPLQRGYVAVVAVVVVVLAAMVGLASADSPWQTEVGGGRSRLPSVVGDVLVVGLAVGICTIAFLVWVLAPERRKERKPGDESDVEQIGASVRAGLLVMLAGLAALAGLCGALYVLLQRAAWTQNPPAVQTGPRASGGGSASVGTPANPVAPDVHWFVLGVLGSIVVLAPLAVLARRRLRRGEPEEGATVADEPVLHAVAESIDEIGRDSNARRAVVRAYARMERALDDAGLPRRPHEAPFEFVERALQRLHVSAAAAGRLAGLFELAHFSQHDIDDAMKRDAVRALRLVQQELEAGT